MSRLSLAVALVSIGVNVALLSYLMLFSGWSFTAIHFAHQVAAPLFAAAGGGLIGAAIYERRVVRV